MITTFKKYKIHFTIATLTFIGACLSAMYFGSIRANEILTASKATPILEQKFSNHSMFDSIKFSQYDAKFDVLIIGQNKQNEIMQNFIRDYQVSQVKNKDEIIEVLSRRRP